MPLRVLACALALAFAPSVGFAQVPSPPQEAAGPQPVVMPLTVNGTAREPVIVQVDGVQVWMRPSDLEAAGLLPGSLPPAALEPIRGELYVNLRSAQSALAFRYDPLLLTLEIDLRPEAMGVNRVTLDPSAARPAPVYPASAYLNYSFTGGYGQPAALFLEGVASFRGHTAQAYVTRDAQGRVYRGPASVMFNDERARRQVVMGDSVWAGAGLLGGVPVGGVTVQSFFGYEPEFVITPTLDLRGVAQTPSTVDVLVNGALVAQRQIPAGPFQLDSIVAQTGQNNVTAVVRDAFGRETRFNAGGFYGAPVLLRPGISTYAVSLGRLRQDRAGEGPDYREGVLLARGATGVTNALTLGASTQLSSATKVAAVQGATTGRLGELSGQIAASRSAGGSGLALTMSWLLTGPTWGLNASMTRRDRNFRDIVVSPLFLLDRPLDSVDLGAARRFLDVDWSLRHTASRTLMGVETRRTSFSAGYRWTDRLSTTLELARSGGNFPDTSVYVLASYILDPAHLLSLAHSRSGGSDFTTVDLTRSRQEALSLGYRLAHSQSSSGMSRQFAQVSRDTSFGDYQVDATNADGKLSGGWRASGALVAIDGTVSATPPVNDAFALVRVGSVPGVPVNVEGRLAGITRADGSLLIPNIVSYSAQRVSIDTEALPLDYEVGEVEQRVSPPLRGGLVLKFEAQVYNAVTGRLLDATGAPVASGVIVLGDGRRIATGTSGDFVIEGARPLGTARVEQVSQSKGCSVRFPEPDAMASPVTRLGELRCTP